MRKKLDLTEGIFPMPVLMVATYNEDGSVNVMNAAWCTMQERGNVALNLSEAHKTVKNIKARGAFTVSMADAENVVACDYVGIESANKVPDKFARAGFHATKSEFVDAPLIDELPMTVECRLISYDPASCRMVGEIVNVSVDESALTPDGEVDVAKVEPISFDPFNNKYVKVTEIVGNAFSDGKELM